MSQSLTRIRIKEPDEKFIKLHRHTRPELYDEAFVKKIAEELPLEYLSRYPDVESFLAKLSAFIDVPVENILVTSGVDGAIRTVYETFIDNSAAVLGPTYKMYDVYAEAYDIPLTTISHDKNFVIDMEDIFSVVEHVDVIFIPNPHEPVETVFSGEQIAEIAERAALHNTIVVIDEAYFMFGAPTVVKAAARFDNLLVMRSLSKGFGLPGLRLGYVTGCRKLIAQMNSRRLAYEANSLALWLAEWAFNNFDFFQKYADEVVASREMIREAMAARGFATHGEYGNSILIKLPSETLMADVCNALEERNILVRNMSHLPHLQTWLSLTIGNKETTNKFLEEFDNVVNSLT